MRRRVGGFVVCREPSPRRGCLGFLIEASFERRRDHPFCKVRWKEGDPLPPEPPLGLDAWAWNNAPDDRAHKRLIRNAKG
jgi:hypothetical protein